MRSASAIRLQIESALANKIPAALSPQQKTLRPTVPTGIEGLDDLLRGGVPVGAVTELIGPECSGRTSVALSFAARTTAAGKLCAWIDGSDRFDPVSAAATGVDLERLLWVRCAAVEKARPAPRSFALPRRYFIPPEAKRGLHGGGFGPHPRTEERGLSAAVGQLLHTPTSKEQKPQSQIYTAPDDTFSSGVMGSTNTVRRFRRAREYDAMERCLRSTDLLLQTGGFAAVVLDLASIPAEFVSRIELATWHRYRLAAEKTRASILLLTQYPCARSCSEVQAQLRPAEPLEEEATVFTGMKVQAEVRRHRFTDEKAVIPMRKPPQSAHSASWQNRTSWACAR